MEHCRSANAKKGALRETKLNCGAVPELRRRDGTTLIVSFRLALAFDCAKEPGGDNADGTDQPCPQPDCHPCQNSLHKFKLAPSRRRGRRHPGADSLTEVETKPEALAPEITLAIHQNCLLFPKTSSRTIQMTDDRGPFPFPAI